MIVTQALIDGEVWFGTTRSSMLTYDPTMLSTLPRHGSEVDIIGGEQRYAILAWHDVLNVWHRSDVLVEVSIVQMRLLRYLSNETTPGPPAWWVTDLQTVVSALDEPR